MRAGGVQPSSRKAHGRSNGKLVKTYAESGLNGDWVPGPANVCTLGELADGEGGGGDGEGGGGRIPLVVTTGDVVLKREGNGGC